MSFLKHHAHIFIGSSTSSDALVFGYLEKQGVDMSRVDIFTQRMSFFSVENARELKRIAHERPSSSDKPMVLITWTEDFFHAAQQVLLKTFEDTPPSIVIIFVTPHEHKLLATLRSRVQMHYLTKTNLVSPIDVALFQKGDIAKRLVLVDQFVSKMKDDDGVSSQDFRREAGDFLGAYEAFLYSNNAIDSYAKEFEAIFFVKQFLFDTGSSVKQLLEHLALAK